MMQTLENVAKPPEHMMRDLVESTSSADIGLPQEIKQNVVADLSCIVGPLLALRTPGQCKLLDDIAEACIDGSSYFDVASNAGVQFISDEGKRVWIAHRDAIILGSSSNGDMFECARYACQALGLQPSIAEAPSIWLLHRAIADILWAYEPQTIVWTNDQQPLFVYREGGSQISDDCKAALRRPDAPPDQRWPRIFGASRHS